MMTINVTFKILNKEDNGYLCTFKNIKTYMQTDLVTMQYQVKDILDISLAFRELYKSINQKELEIYEIKIK